MSTNMSCTAEKIIGQWQAKIAFKLHSTIVYKEFLRELDFQRILQC